MRKKEGLFVRINYNNSGVLSNIKDTGNKALKNNDINVAKYLLCAGTYNKNGGTMIFQAKNMDEAEKIVLNNPFVKSKVYTYEILKGDIIAL